MENLIHYDSLLILSVLAFITPIFISSFKKFKIPFVVGEILIGVIFGKSFLNLVSNDIWIEFLSIFGLAYQMFLSGLEINFDAFFYKNRESKKIKIRHHLFMFALALSVSYILSLLLYNKGIIKEPSLIAFIFVSAAPGLIVPFLKDRDLLNTSFGQDILLFSVICQFLCLISFSTISAYITTGLSYKNFLFILVFVAAFFIYKLFKAMSHHYNNITAAYKNLHLNVRAAFAVIMVMVTLSYKLGSEIIVGAFLAGVIFSLTAERTKEELKYKLDVIGYGFFIPIFFIMIGVNLDLRSVFRNSSSILLIPLFLIIIFVVKLLPAILMGLHLGKNKGLASSFLFSAQLTPMIVGAQMGLSLGLIDSSIYATIILTVIISCILFPILFDKFYTYDAKIVPYSGTSRIIIKEVIPQNENIINNRLEDIQFPIGCRIFIILRDDKEIMPDGKSIILPGDVLVLAGLSESIDEMIRLLE